ncbi:MAG: hypothetical protein AAF899_18170 [Pseudomonadota bacterium]
MLSIALALAFTAIWLAVLPDLRHPNSWLNQRLAALGAGATTGAVVAFGLVALMLSPLGRAFGGAALQKLRMLLVTSGLCVTAVSLLAMRSVGLALAAARRRQPEEVAAGDGRTP